MTTLNLQVTASTDDARQDGSTMDLTGTVIRINSSTRYGGFRFLSPTGIEGSTIDTATMTVDISNASNDDPDVIIYCDTANTPATFSTTNNDITDRVETTASVAWNATGVGSGSATTPSLVSIVQEVADNGSFDESAIVFTWHGQSGNSIQVKTFDQSSTVAALCDIDFTAAGAGQPTTLRATTVPGMRQWQSRY